MTVDPEGAYNQLQRPISSTLDYLLACESSKSACHYLAIDLLRKLMEDYDEKYRIDGILVLRFLKDLEMITNTIIQQVDPGEEDGASFVLVQLLDIMYAYIALDIEDVAKARRALAQLVESTYPDWFRTKYIDGKPVLLSETEGAEQERLSRMN